MRTIVIGLIVAAVVLAGGTAFMLSSYLSNQEATIAAMAPKEPSVQVLVAGANLPAGTVINASNVTWQGWPEDGVNDDFITEESSDDPVSDLEKEKNVVRHAFAKGDPIIKRKLHSPNGKNFMRGTLKPGMRAVAIGISPGTASGGFILPGDRVDIILTHGLLKKALTTQGGDDGSTIMSTVSETIMENVLVLAIDQKISEFEAGSSLGKNVLLEVTPRQAEKLITAKNMGKMSVLLRSLEDVEKYSNNDGPGYTTDVQVSPTLSSLDAVLAGKKAATKDAKASEDARDNAANTRSQSTGKIKVFK